MRQCIECGKSFETAEGIISRVCPDYPSYLEQTMN